MGCFGEYMKSAVVFAQHSVVDYKLVGCENYQSLPFLPTSNQFFNSVHEKYRLFSEYYS